jgi:hypothetical protein
MNVAILLLIQGVDQVFTGRASTDDDGAPGEPSVPHPASHEGVKDGAENKQCGETHGPEGQQPAAREHLVEFQEEGDGGRQQEDKRPGRDQPRQLIQRTAERIDLVNVDRLKRDHRTGGDSGDGPDIGPTESFRPDDIEAIDQRPDQRDQRAFHHAHETVNDDWRISRTRRFGRGCDGGRGHLPRHAPRRIRGPNQGRADRGSAHGFLSVQFQHFAVPWLVTQTRKIRVQAFL